jgi:hypothetical protein
MDEIAKLFNEYGAWALIGYIVWRDVFPTLRDNLSATHKARLAREEQERQEKAAIEAEERKRSAELQERTNKVLDRFSEQLGTFGLALTTIAERLTSIERDQDAMRYAMQIVADRMGINQPNRNGKD